MTDVEHTLEKVSELLKDAVKKIRDACNSNDWVDHPKPFRRRWLDIQRTLENVVEDHDL